MSFPAFGKRGLTEDWAGRGIGNNLKGQNERFFQAGGTVGIFLRKFFPSRVV